MGNSSPQPVQTQQQTTSEPWAKQQPYLQYGFEQAKQNYENPDMPQFYPGTTFATPSAETLAGLAGTGARALAGSPTLAAAQNEATKSLSGDYLSAGNPYFSKMADTVTAHVLPGLDNQFIGAGRVGSGLHGRAIGEGLGSAIGSLAYQNYDAERNRMAGNVAAAPGLASADYLDPQALTQVGAAREAIAQKPIDEAMARFNFQQNLPQAKLADYMQTVQGNYGGMTNTLGTQFLPRQNPFASILGGAASGAGIIGGTGGFGPTGWLTGLFSDERLKKDIKRVGETDEGLPIYTYRYKMGGPPMMGVMAQEVAEVKPEAVAMTPSGYLAVDYAQVN